MNKILPAFIFTLMTGSAGFAQIVGTEGFIIGDYVEIGVSGAGGFEGAVWNAASPPVPGAHYRSSTSFFGFVANPQMDGWVNYDGDFFTPGSPENGWGFEIIDGANDIKISSNCAVPTSGTGIDPHFTSIGLTGYTYTGGLQTLTWEGDFDSLAYSLHFTIQYSLYDTAMAYVTTVTVNNTGDPIDEFYYYRNIDPDNNQSISGSFTTTNTIVAQASWLSPFASVKAEQSLPWPSLCSISATDSMARVSKGGFSNRDASDIWHGTGGLSSSGVSTADEAISIAFKADSLSFTRAEHSFSFATSFKGVDIVTGIDKPQNESLSIYPNPTTGLLNITTSEKVQAITVYDLSGKQQKNLQNLSVIDLSELQPGIYFVKVKTDRSVITKKILKQ